MYYPPQQEARDEISLLNEMKVRGYNNEKIARVLNRTIEWVEYVLLHQQFPTRNEYETYRRDAMGVELKN